jgi:hypothetical protein
MFCVGRQVQRLMDAKEQGGWQEGNKYQHSEFGPSSNANSCLEAYCESGDFVRLQEKGREKVGRRESGNFCLYVHGCHGTTTRDSWPWLQDDDIEVKIS